MAICNQCGSQIPEDAAFCPNCGTQAAVQETVQEQPQQAPQQQYATPQQQYGAPQQQYGAPQQQYGAPQQQYGAPQQQYGAPQQQYTAPQQQYTAPQQVYMTPEMDVQQSRGIAWLSYLGLLFLIPMFVKKNSPYTRFHVKQGATLCALEIAYGITTQILLAIINLIFPGYSFYGYVVHSTVYNIFNILLSLGYIFFTVVAIIGIVNAAKGQQKELPLISQIPWIAKLLDNTIYKQ